MKHTIHKQFFHITEKIAQYVIEFSSSLDYFLIKKYIPDTSVHV